MRVLLLIISLLLSACTANNYNTKKEIDFSKIINYSIKNNCNSSYNLCKKGDITFFANSYVVVIKIKGEGKVLHFIDSKIIQMTKDNFENDTFFFQENIESQDLEKQQKKLENNRIILSIINKLLSLI